MRRQSIGRLPIWVTRALTSRSGGWSPPVLAPSFRKGRPELRASGGGEIWHANSPARFHGDAGPGGLRRYAWDVRLRDLSPTAASSFEERLERAHGREIVVERDAGRRDPRTQRGAIGLVARQPHGGLDIGLVRLGDELGKTRAPQWAARQSTAQEGPFVRHDRQPAFERLHRSVEAGEADGVEVYVGALHQAVERGPRLPGQENDEFVRLETGVLEGERGAIRRGYRPPVRRIHATEVRQGDQPLGVVRLCLRRLEIVAREIEVDRRQTRRLGVTPACRLDRREAEAREPHGHRIHANFGVDDGVELPLGDEIRPLLQGSPPLVKARSPRARVSRLAVSVCAEVKDVELDPATVEVRKPASYARTPYRMIVNLRRRDTDAQVRFLGGPRNRLGGTAFLPVRHQPCA